MHPHSVNMMYTPDSGHNEGVYRFKIKATHQPKRQDPSPEDDLISYHELTFNTILPLIPPQGADHLDHQLPPCPDLGPYASPLAWPLACKNILLALSCIAAFLTAYSAGSFSPPSPIIAEVLDTSQTLVLVGITTFCFGFAIAPMALAPISEVWGRYLVFILAGFLFTLFQALCPLVTSFAAMLVVRFLVGVGGSVFSSVVGGVIADLWDKDERNTLMALFSGSVLLGTGIGPLAAAALINNLRNDLGAAWKWVFWHQAILSGALLLALALLFKESRASVLLSRKAKLLNRWYAELESLGVYVVWVRHGVTTPSSLQDVREKASRVDYNISHETHPWGQLVRVRWVTQTQEPQPIFHLVGRSIYRPFYLLFTEPIVFYFSLWAAFSWGILFLSFTIVPYLYADDLGQSSRPYAAIMASAVIATATSIAQESLLRHPGWKSRDAGSEVGFWAFMRTRFPVDSPEARLYFACPTTLLLPAGLFIAFLSPGSEAHYSRPIGIGLANWGIYSVYLASSHYLVDIYHIHASLALAAQGFCRNTLCGIFPVITTMMFDNLGLKNVGLCLGGIATGLSIIPWVLVFFGKSIRSRSGFAASLPPR